MAGGGRIGGQGSLIQRGIWIFVACCIVVAIWNTFPHDPKGFHAELRHKSEQLKGVAVDVSGWFGLERLESDTDKNNAPAPKPKKHPAKDAR